MPSRERYLYGLCCVAIGLTLGIWQGRKYPTEDAVLTGIEDQLQYRYRQGYNDGVEEVRVLVEKDCRGIIMKADPEKQKFLQ